MTKRARHVHVHVYTQCCLAYIALEIRSGEEVLSL